MEEALVAHLQKHFYAILFLAILICFSTAHAENTNNNPLNYFRVYQTQKQQSAVTNTIPVQQSNVKQVNNTQNNSQTRINIGSQHNKSYQADLHTSCGPAYLDADILADFPVLDGLGNPKPNPPAMMGSGGYVQVKNFGLSPEHVCWADLAPRKNPQATYRMKGRISKDVEDTKIYNEALCKLFEASLENNIEVYVRFEKTACSIVATGQVVSSNLNIHIAEAFPSTKLVMNASILPVLNLPIGTLYDKPQNFIDAVIVFLSEDPMLGYTIFGDAHNENARFAYMLTTSMKDPNVINNAIKLGVTLMPGYDDVIARLDKVIDDLTTKKPLHLQATVFTNDQNNNNQAVLMLTDLQ